MALDLLNDPNYTEANEATKKAIFEKHIASSSDYSSANDATKNAIRQRYGITTSVQKSNSSLITPDEMRKQVGAMTNPFKEMSGEDWQEKSLLAPAIKYAGGKVLPSLGMMKDEEGKQWAKEGEEQLVQKGKNFYEGAKRFMENPWENTKAVASHISENPGEFIGETGKSLIYDPEQLIAGPIASTTGKVIAKTAGKVGGAVKPAAVATKEALKEHPWTGGVMNAPSNIANSPVGTAVGEGLNLVGDVAKTVARPIHSLKEIGIGVKNAFTDADTAIAPMEKVRPAIEAAVKSGELPQWKATVAEVNNAMNGGVPYEGQALRGTTEQIVRSAIAPFQKKLSDISMSDVGGMALDIGGMMTTGIPLRSSSKALTAMANHMLERNIKVSPDSVGVVGIKNKGKNSAFLDTNAPDMTPDQIEAAKADLASRGLDKSKIFNQEDIKKYQKAKQDLEPKLSSSRALVPVGKVKTPQPTIYSGAGGASVDPNKAFKAADKAFESQLIKEKPISPAESAAEKPVDVVEQNKQKARQLVEQQKAKDAEKRAQGKMVEAPVEEKPTKKVKLNKSMAKAEAAATKKGPVFEVFGDKPEEGMMALNPKSVKLQKELDEAYQKSLDRPEAIGSIEGAAKAKDTKVFSKKEFIKLYEDTGTKLKKSDYDNLYERYKTAIKHKGSLYVPERKSGAATDANERALIEFEKRVNKK